MNLFDDFDLDIVKITNEKQGLRSCDDPLNGSSTGPIGSTSCVCYSHDTCPNTEITMRPSECNNCSEDPKCQTLEGRCE